MVNKALATLLAAVAATLMRWGRRLNGKSNDRVKQDICLALGFDPSRVACVTLHIPPARDPITAEIETVCVGDRGLSELASIIEGAREHVVCVVTNYVMDYESGSWKRLEKARSSPEPERIVRDAG